MPGDEVELRPRATRFLPNPKDRIQNLGSDISLKIRRALDAAPPDRNWRALVAAMVKRFPYSQIEVEQFGLAVNRPDGSPTQKLMTHLGSRGFRIGDLIQYLDVLGWEYLLLDLKPYEKIKVLSMPREKVTLHVGDTLTLSVSATGFPYPHYQWFRGNDQVTGAIESTLMISGVQQADSGSYCCRLHNTSDEDKVVFTRMTAVNVKRNPEEATWPEPAPRPASPQQGQAPEILDQSKLVSVIVGKPFSLYCMAIGAHPLEYCWLKNGNQELCTSNTYTVEQASVVDTASYECVVKNRYGELRSRVIPVKVSSDTGTDVTRLTPVSTFTFKDYRPDIASITSTGTCVLDIIAHPKSCTLEKGGSALFYCQAVGKQPIGYQWYRDGHPIPGETSDHLALRVINSFDQEGSFQCRVWNKESELLSAAALLKLDLDVPMVASGTVGTIHTATDKIALLIGNYDYSGTDLLKAPKVDVQVLAELLRSMQYKVVSLLNLTLGEMEAAVLEFCSLLCGDGGVGGMGSGVYGLFYFCGHGTEEKGQCYLVPQDAPTGYSSSNCLCAQKVLQQMQDANPALCTMILDCCRIDPDNPPETPLKLYKPRAMGNIIYLYATTLGMRAWEYESRADHLPLGHLYKRRPCKEIEARVNEEPNGVLVQHLRRHLCRRKPVEAIFAQVREDISKDPKVHKVQIPVVETNLVKPQQSLADKIIYTGHTEVFTKRTKIWRDAHIKPENCSVHIKALGVTVELEYRADFSNVLSIMLTVSDPGKTSQCHAWIVNLPPTLSVMDLGILSHSPAKTKIVLQDIQKLKEPLTLTISLQYLNERRENCTYEHEPIQVGLPLISTLALWKGERNPLISHREPTEHNQDEDAPVYANMSPTYMNSPSSHMGGSSNPSTLPSFPSSFPTPPSLCSKNVKYVNT